MRHTAIQPPLRPTGRGGGAEEPGYPYGAIHDSWDEVLPWIVFSYNEKYPPGAGGPAGGAWSAPPTPGLEMFRRPSGSLRFWDGLFSSLALLLAGGADTARSCRLCPSSVAADCLPVLEGGPNRKHIVLP